MTILTMPSWDAYTLLDSGNGAKLEQFGSFLLSRPDPQVLWGKKLPQSQWAEADAYFKRIKEDKGIWQRKKTMPLSWSLSWRNLTFILKLTPFKHTGIFPEQIVQWDWMRKRIIQEKRQVSILNLFGYTGGATLALAEAGARVTHVDASKPAVYWARENQSASKMDEKPIRWIVDDATDFSLRELRRGNRYDAIIMDPPVYGHGPKGQLWKFSEHFPKLVKICSQLLSAHPLFFLTNAYALSSSPIMLGNVLNDFLRGGTITVGELTVREKKGKRLLSTGMYALWERFH